MSAITLGEFVRIRREKFKLQQKDIAAEVGIDPTQISRLESGKQKEPNVIPIARALKVRPGLLTDLLADDITLEEAMRESNLADRGMTLGTYTIMTATGPQQEIVGSNLTLPEGLLDEDIEDILNYIDLVAERRQYRTNRFTNSSGQPMQLNEAADLISSNTRAAAARTLERQRREARERQSKVNQRKVSSSNNNNNELKEVNNSI